jgi:ABC-2 type transport system permease protein
MSTIAVAKKDFRDGIRSWLVIGLIVLFALFIAGVVYFATEISPITQGTPQMIKLLGAMIGPTYILLPIVGTMVGYKAIVGERTSGSLKFLLGLPHTRRDVVFGKLLGRSGIVTVAVLVGFAVGGVVLYAFSTAFALDVFLIYTAVTILLGVTFVSIAIAFSSITRSASVATAGAITLVLVFTFFWQVFLALVRYAGETLGLIGASQPSPEWYLFVRDLHPIGAYRNAILALLNAISPGTPPVTEPFYLQHWFGFVILGFWLIVPIGLAYLRFDRADL